jgi:UDP-glucose 4-epimerase
MVIPRFVQQALRQEPLTVYGDGTQSRCFLHVRDAVAAITALSECSEAVGKLFNIGSTHEITILELARMVLRLVYAAQERPEQPDDDQIRLIPYEEAYNPGFEDMRRRMPDLTRIQQYIGWQPSLSLEQILLDVMNSTQQHS